MFQQSAITGVPAIKARWEVCLLEEQAKTAFINSRNVCELELPGLSYDDLTSALAICADDLYKCAPPTTHHHFELWPF